MIRRIIIYLFITNVINYSCLAQADNLKNSLLIFRLEGTNDSTLLNDNYYFFVDSLNFLQLVDQPFRFNLFMPDFDFNSFDSSTMEYQRINRYEPKVSVSSSFKFIKDRKSINLLFKDDNKIEKEKFINLDSQIINIQKGFLYQIGNWAISETKHTSQYLGFASIQFRNKTIKCYKVIEHVCNNIKNFYRVIYIDCLNMIPLKIDEYIYNECGDFESRLGNSSKRSTFNLFGVLKMDYKQIKGLHIWGRKKL